MLVVETAREVVYADEQAGDLDPPEPGDLVVETSIPWIDPDAIGVLVWCGYAPYSTDDLDTMRFVWDVYPLSGAHGKPIAGHGRLLQRWENAAFKVVQDLDKVRLFASLKSSHNEWERLDVARWPYSR
jgi:hypothetical protein